MLHSIPDSGIPSHHFQNGLSGHPIPYEVVLIVVENGHLVYYPRMDNESIVDFRWDGVPPVEDQSAPAIGQVYYIGELYPVIHHPQILEETHEIIVSPLQQTRRVIGGGMGDDESNFVPPDGHNRIQKGRKWGLPGLIEHHCRKALRGNESPVHITGRRIRSIFLHQGSPQEENPPIRKGKENIRMSIPIVVQEGRKCDESGAIYEAASVRTLRAPPHPSIQIEPHLPRRLPRPDFHNLQFIAEIIKTVFQIPHHDVIPGAVCVSVHTPLRYPLKPIPLSDHEIPIVRVYGVPGEEGDHTGRFEGDKHAGSSVHRIGEHQGIPL